MESKASTYALYGPGNLSRSIQALMRRKRYSDLE